jgi:D-sedoheptulose 7-phosphate isomerase
MIIDCYSRAGKLLICGNGGSSSDADHFAAELMKSFEAGRPLDESLKERFQDISGSRGRYLGEKLEHSLPAISLPANTALSTAISNDIDPSLIYAQQVIGYGEEGDVLVAISTSGNSQNIVDACIAAKALNLNVIGISGKTGGKMKQFCDLLVNVPETRTAWVQELHLPVLHAISLIVENHFYSH